ncbi:hypothetical protein CC80DRAFT_521428 [Byssothecium circinans]|uniref:Cora-domain-containing protein n=1 Tax=Byssothecium circinans TaxID=147558 RepID=A0A6A5UKE3_9PLEO|nr:hypothetical protein CC80DRAFT_521428 [Byssothecium circinans]
MATSSPRGGLPDAPPIMVHDMDRPPTEQAQSRSSTTYDHPNPQTQNAPTNARFRGDSTREKGHRRKHSPNLTWHLPYKPNSFENGRVLLIDYVSQEYSGPGRRKIVAQEFRDVEELRKFYRNEALSRQAALRVIHVQNASWALRFLFNKFNISSKDDLVGTKFARWAKYEKPQRRGGKPVLNGRSFRAQRDPWRGISRAAFGTDYLRHYEKNTIQKDDGQVEKMMELNSYDDLDQPAYAWDVFVQRLGVYVQMSDGEPGLPVDSDFENPYYSPDSPVEQRQPKDQERTKPQHGKYDGPNGHYVPKLETLDNGSTIILIETSQSGSVADTLIGARQEIEQRWRRLTFYLPLKETDSDASVALQCADLVLRDIFKAMAFTWEKYITICETHTGILEDKIYENPADESRAPELWINSSLWLKVERLMYLHSDICKEMKNHLKEMLGLDLPEDQTWLSQSAEELDKLITQFQEGVIKPTTSLSDLMYKSVGIRDARHSLQLGLSMWRLSWITFIFLPLTFMCSFFGMNVDTFESNPPIKWFFASALPLLLVMMASWYIIKHAVASQKQDPLRRGVYETLYHSLSIEHPNLWTRKGPRMGVVPVGWWADLKWQLLQRWYNPDRTLATRGSGSFGPGDEELGIYSRVKRNLARRWLSDLPVMPMTSSQADLMAETPIAAHSMGAVAELVNLATPVAAADGDPTAASRIRRRNLLGKFRSLSPAGSERRPNSASRESSDGRPGSGVMVEEKGLSEDERSGGEEESAETGTGRKGRRMEDMLNVPLRGGSPMGGL